MNKIRECTIDDLYILKEISYNTYDDTFKPFNTPENMSAYLESAYNIEKLKIELQDKNSKFYFIYVDDDLGGYIKINENEAQTDIHDPNALEVERLYIKKEYHGMGLGKVLMEEAIDIAKSRGKSHIWLGVWEKNYNAQKFYKKFGFYQIGSHPFVMGDDEQTDLILRKELE